MLHELGESVRLLSLVVDGGDLNILILVDLAACHRFRSSDGWAIWRKSDRYFNSIEGLTIGAFSKYLHNEIFDK